MSDTGIPIVNGRSAEVAVKGAVMLLAMLIIAITVIVSTSNEIPEIFTSMATLIVGFLIGSRTVTNGVKEQVITKETREGP